MARTILWVRTNAEGFDEDVHLPARYEVCPRCEGHGKHTNPNIDGHGITASEMDELGPDFYEDYMSGVYDVTCERCRGLRVVLVVDEDECDPTLLKEYLEEQEFEARIRAVDEYERRMGC